ncbi:vp39 capsid [Spodoptera litura granulovirus]|uniref:Vp39 capsid n=1 Tax=Spodoptera litura granulovirus TaxID=359919 RepID=A5IZT9_9BBAC|nr:vp39 capsid [Spodoptera litura granulovirus]ABQ52030.1 vp39 capsid [Spodoptera litura granulovirus]
MNNSTVACVLRNYCIFQGVQPPEYMNCGTYIPPCSPDANNNDFTFICNHHLEKYFKIKKQAMEIPSGTSKSYLMLVGVSLIQQDVEEARRILIPTKANYYTYLGVNNMSSTEKFVFYSIYDEPDTLTPDDANRPDRPPGGRVLESGVVEGPRRALCTSLASQEYYTEDVMANLSSIVSFVIGQISPSYYCRPEVQETLREYPEPDARVFADMPVFIKNLITRLVRPIKMVINNITLNIEQQPTCSLQPNRGLIPANLYNPEKPKFLREAYRIPKFQIRSVMEFEGRATQQQEALRGYEIYTIARPLLLGTEIVPQSY